MPSMIPLDLLQSLKKYSLVRQLQFKEADGVGLYTIQTLVKSNTRQCQTKTSPRTEGLVPLLGTRCLGTCILSQVSKQKT